MQLRPIFPNDVSKSRTTPTLTGIVVFCAMPISMKRTHRERKKRANPCWARSFLIFELLLGSLVIHNNAEYSSFIGSRI